MGCIIQGRRFWSGYLLSLPNQSRLSPALYPSTGVVMLPCRTSQWPKFLCVCYRSKKGPRRGGGRAVAPSPRHISNRRRRSSRLCSKRLRKGMRCKARWKIPLRQNPPTKTEKIAKRAENRRAPFARAKTIETPQNYAGNEGKKNAAHPDPPPPLPPRHLAKTVLTGRPAKGIPPRRLIPNYCSAMGIRFFPPSLFSAAPRDNFRRPCCDMQGRRTQRDSPQHTRDTHSLPRERTRRLGLTARCPRRVRRPPAVDAGTDQRCGYANRGSLCLFGSQMKSPQDRIAT